MNPIRVQELFKILLSSQLNEDRSSLIVFENAYKDLSGIGKDKTVRFTFISDRLKCV